MFYHSRKSGSRPAVEPRQTAENPSLADNIPSRIARLPFNSTFILIKEFRRRRWVRAEWVSEREKKKPPWSNGRAAPRTGITDAAEIVGQRRGAPANLKLHRPPDNPTPDNDGLARCELGIWQEVLISSLPPDERVYSFILITAAAPARLPWIKPNNTPPPTTHQHHRTVEPRMLQDALNFMGVIGAPIRGTPACSSVGTGLIRSGGWGF